MTVECIWSAEALLGEGPVWSARHRALWFTDIKGGRLHRLDPATGSKSTFDVPGQPGFIVPCDDGTFLIGMGRKLCRFSDGEIGKTIADLDMDPCNRLNDGAVDASGRLWFGSMDDSEKEETGAVYLFDGASVRHMGGVCPITNGPALSADGRFLYHVDTLGKAIWRFDIGAREALTDGELFLKIPDGEGYPDGAIIDSEGCLWLALWGGWAVKRYSPEGKLLETVKLPCSQVTKMAFGGSDLKTAFVTTARIGLSAPELERQPLAGGLFAFETGVPGVASCEVSLKGDR